MFSLGAKIMKETNMNDQVIIFDTTLRDGEQALSASLTVKEKLQIAYALERLGVDVIEEVMKGYNLDLYEVNDF